MHAAGGNRKLVGLLSVLSLRDGTWEAVTTEVTVTVTVTI